MPTAACEDTGAKDTAPYTFGVWGRQGGWVLSQLSTGLGVHFGLVWAWAVRCSVQCGTGLPEVVREAGAELG